MKVVIIDDDSRVTRVISNLINSEFDDITITGTAGNLESGYNVLLKDKPDLLFLDISLPDGNAFELLKKIRNIDFKIIFITAFEEFALQAIKVSALDFIVKPIDINELKNSINKAREIIKQEDENLKIKAFIENLEGKKKLKRIILPTSDYLHFIDINNIIRCEADNNYTFFYLADCKKILVSKTIKEYSNLLRDSGFIRVHQSHLVNAIHIDKYVKSEGGYLLMTDKSSVPVSSANRHQILKALEPNS